MAKNKNLHLLWRSGFGPDLSMMNDIENLSPKQLWSNIKANAKTPLPALLVSDTFVQDNYQSGGNTKAMMGDEERREWNKKIRYQSAKDIKELNHNWIALMIKSPNQLGEKMSFFWHHHFAIRHNNSFLQQEAVNIIRKHALGNFGDLLREISKSGAMILSLNNQQNKKRSPNENFAREVMELFAMGIGNYTENDIKEAARAFTGWATNPEGRFEFKREQHDNSIKNVLGQSGRFDGDDIIAILLQQPQTASFIVSKIYSYFVDEIPDFQKIEKLATSFRKDYNIMNLLNDIFGSDWFFDKQHIGNKIKTPIDLLVGIQRFSPFEAIHTDLQNRLQKLLGQILFNPPSIAGWPLSKNWLDSGTLVIRLQLPQIINGAISINIKAKANDDIEMGLDNPDNEIKTQNHSKASLNKQWKDWATQTKDSALSSIMVVPDLSKEKVSLIQSQANGNKHFFWSGVMSLPEYQLC